MNSKGQIVLFYKPGEHPPFMEDKKIITTGLPSHVAQVIIHWNNEITEVLVDGTEITYEKPTKPVYMLYPDAVAKPLDASPPMKYRSPDPKRPIVIDTPTIETHTSST
jgi:hypothetical protein